MSRETPPPPRSSPTSRHGEWTSDRVGRSRDAREGSVRKKQRPEREMPRALRFDLDRSGYLLVLMVTILEVPAVLMGPPR